MFVDTSCSVDIMFMDCLRKIKSTLDVKPVVTSLFDFAGEAVLVAGKVRVLREWDWKQNRTITFMLVDTSSQYNVILGRPSLRLLLRMRKNE